MGTRTFRLDDKTERALEEIRRGTGLSIAEVLKRGIQAFRKEVSRRTFPAPFEIYRELDLGPGGYAKAPSTDVGRGVREALRKKRRH